MAKVTSKRQVTIPKAIADKYGIQPGDELAFVPAGEAIRVEPGAGGGTEKLSRKARLELFDAATTRQRARERARERAGRRGRRRRPGTSRGWTREELYTRGRPG